MTASASRMSTFTITQPFLGAPLQFQPALGSQELEALIDAYVVGPASKQDKLSEVTIDFYNRATVDLSNGSLVRRYDVALFSHTFGQSPTQSQSSGFSPIYTPSPGSSATFGDSGNASSGMSMTPPNRSRNGRVSKKAAKKDTKKAVELRLPGFSIMTKDGIDVTSSAGRGTKTKEQREHAHMMRIMKACDECKKKKVRCDPLHRSPNYGSSAASTNTTKISSPSRQNPSPPSIGPPICPEVTHATSTGDFILFPESSSAWNPADLYLSDFESQPCDLSNFDFDINNIDLNEFTTLNDDESFDWSFTQQSLPVEQYSSSNPLIGDPFGFDQYASLDSLSPISSGNHGSTYLGDLEQRGSSTSTSSFLGVETPERSRTSAMTPLQWPDYVVESPGQSFSSGSGSGSVELSTTSLSSSSYAESLDWAAGKSSGSQSVKTDASSPDAAQSSMGSSGQVSGGNNHILHIPGSDSSSYFSRSLASMNFAEQRSPASDQQVVPIGSLHGQNPPTTCGFSDWAVLLDQEHICSVVERAVQAVKSAPAEYLVLSGELGQLRRRLNALKHSYNHNVDRDDPDPSTSSLQDLVSDLQTLVTRVENLLKSGRATSSGDNRLSLESRLEQSLWQFNAGRLRSISATVTNLQAPNDEASPATSNTCVLTSSRNQQLLISPDERHSHDARLALAIPRQELETPSVLHSWTTNGLASLPDGGLLLQEVDAQDSGKRHNITSQLEMASLILLPALLLACLSAVSLAVLSLVARLAFQISKFIATIGVISVGFGPLASATEPLPGDPLASFIFSRMTPPQPSPLLAVAALMLPLSIGSSASLVSSSKHISSKLSRKPTASHWLGKWQGMSIGSSML